MYADLHLHSTFSDGTDTPIELLKMAEESNIKVIAISDHDSVEGVKTINNSNLNIDVRLIPAIEISTIFNHRYMHILGYYINIYSDDLASFITKISAEKTENTRINFQNAKERCRLSYEWDRVVELNRDQPRISGVHVVKAMEHDKIQLQGMSLWEMFKKYFRAESPYFIETEKMTAYDAINIINKVNGIPVIGHPKSIGDDSIVLDLIDYGARGIEVFHPIHSKEERKKYDQIAKDKKLYITGGSDWHGKNSDPEIAHIGICGLTHDGYEILQL